MLLASEYEALNKGSTHWFVESEKLADWLPGLTSKFDIQALAGLLEAGWSHGIIHTLGRKPLAIFFAALPSRKSIIISCNKRLFLLGDCWVDNAKTIKENAEVGLAIGLALYIRCFPEAVKPGFPDFAKHPAHYKNERCVSIIPVPAIQHHDSPCGHFRNGHVRYLASDKFTKMKGQWVWVTETYVKGKAFTVHEL